MALHRIKVVVSGAFNAGKTQFIATISEIPPVMTERRVTDASHHIKPLTTAALDFGRVSLDDNLKIYLYGTPGQQRFAFMRGALAKGMRGLVLLVDSTQPDTFAEARQILDFFAALCSTPALIVANKQDSAGAVTPEQLHSALHLPANSMVVPCVATDPLSVRRVLRELLALPTVVPQIETQATSVASHTVWVPIQPKHPAPLATVALYTWGRTYHLTTGNGYTLCGKQLTTTALEVLTFGDTDCQECIQHAHQLGLTCIDCGRPLNRSAGQGLCLGCAMQRISEARDAHLELETLDFA